MSSPRVAEDSAASSANDSSEVVLLKRRLRHTQQNIQFLQDQHKNTLSDLHAEVDRLKMQNREQQWRLVLSGQINSNQSDADLVQKLTNLSTQTDFPKKQEESIQLKRLEEENADLKSEIESLRRANLRFKSELLNHSKKLEISPRQQDTVRRLVKNTHRSRFSPRNNMTSPRSSSANSLRVIARPGNKLLPAIHGDIGLNEEVVEGVTLPALRGVNQNVQHQRRLQARKLI